MYWSASSRSWPASRMAASRRRRRAVARSPVFAANADLHPGCARAAVRAEARNPPRRVAPGKLYLTPSARAERALRPGRLALSRGFRQPRPNPGIRGTSGRACRATGVTARASRGGGAGRPSRGPSAQPAEPPSAGGPETILASGEARASLGALVRSRLNWRRSMRTLGCLRPARRIARRAEEGANHGKAARRGHRDGIRG